MSVTPALRERVHNVEAQVRDQRERVKEARDRRDRLRDDFAATDLSQGSKEFKAVQSAQTALTDSEQRLTELEAEQVAVLRQASGLSDWGNPLAAGGLSDSAQIGDLARAANSSRPLGDRNLGVVISRDQLLARMDRNAFAAAGDVSLTGTGARTAPLAGIVPQLHRRLTVLDLMRRAPAENKVTPYVVESGSFDTAAETAEATDKPPAAATYTDAEAVARTIAHWLKIPKQQLADVAGLQQTITNRLAAGVLQRLETQVIGGDGTGENLLGILNTTGLATVAYSADELAADLTLDGISGLLAAGANPSAVVLNPADWSAMLKAKASGSGEYLSMGPFVATATSLWDTPVVTNPAITQGTALVGDFAEGVTLLVREGVNVLLSDSDSDDFTNNRVTLLGEGRFALAVWRPASFCVVELASSGT